MECMKVLKTSTTREGAPTEFTSPDLEILEEKQTKRISLEDMDTKAEDHEMEAIQLQRNWHLEKILRAKSSM